jgi:hypothetical protein
LIRKLCRLSSSLADHGKSTELVVDGINTYLSRLYSCQNQSRSKQAKLEQRIRKNSQGKKTPDRIEFRKGKKISCQIQR